MGVDCDNVWIVIGDCIEGVVSVNGLIKGCYLYGLFSVDVFCSVFLVELGVVLS